MELISENSTGVAKIIHSRNKDSKNYFSYKAPYLLLNLKDKSQFSKIFSYSTVTIIFSHFFINIGMVLGLVPTIGIPLPFFSYGGSNLIGFVILISIYIRLDSQRTSKW